MLDRPRFYSVISEFCELVRSRTTAAPRRTRRLWNIADFSPLITRPIPARTARQAIVSTAEYKAKNFAINKNGRANQRKSGFRFVVYN